MIWLRRVGVLCGFAALLIVGGVVANELSGDSGGYPTLDPDIRQIAGGLATSNRQDLAICVDALGYPPDAAEKLRKQVVLAVPAIRSADWRGFYPDGPVRVDIGCPETSRSEYPSAVSRPSEYRLFVNMVPASEVPLENIDSPYWSRGSEDVCSGDSCSEVTNGIYVSDRVLCNQDWFAAILIRVLGVGDLRRAPINSC